MSVVDLSVVIPTHNRKEMLREMLTTLSQQSLSLEAFEVVVVVDGSTDGTQEMLEGLNTPYRLRVVSQKQSGVAVTRNRGAEAASGRILLFLDDDILPHPTLLEEHMKTQTQNPPGVVLGRMDPSGNGNRGGWNMWEERALANHYKRIAAGRRPAAGRRLYSGNFSVPKEPFLRLGGFSEELRRGEDVELGYRLERGGVPFYFNLQASAIHRGYRGFQSWCNSAYQYGRTDIALALERGHSQVISDVFEGFHRRPTAIRLSVRIGLGRRLLRGAMIHSLRATSGMLTRIGLYKLAHPGYSVIFHLHYWQGVASQVGGRRAVMERLKLHTPAKAVANAREQSRLS